jgi:hypothetical protein
MVTAAIFLCQFLCPRALWVCHDPEEPTRVYGVSINPLVEPS